MDIAVIGLGKLGSPLAAVLASKGHQVVGVDLNPAAVAALNAGRAPVTEPGLPERIAAAGSRLRATSDFNEAIPAADISFVIVPTPSGPDGRFTNRFVLDAVRRIGAALKATDRYHVVNITSTVMPGSTGGEIRKALEAASGRVVGRDLGLTYNPEFIALGSVVRDLLYPDMILIGESDPRAGDMLAAVYESTAESRPPVQRMNWVSAEITKIAVNTFVTTKISYANMLAEICEKLPGADVDSVTAALGKDSRIGAKYLKGALGYGGPCFPRDNVALAALARGLDVGPDIAVATDAINRRQVDRVVGLASRLANGNSNIAVLGMAYKPHTPVVEESQGVMIARALAAAGHAVMIADPVALDSATAVLGDAVTPMGDAGSAIQAAGVVVIATNAPEYAALTAADFAGARRIVLDCWRVLTPDIAEVADVVHLGRGLASEG
ncbi:MAG TPA: nucleotide sugar dehydrogenase [Acetobacteraceae bacterium]